MEDSPTVRIALQDLLERLGVPPDKIQQASTGQECLDKYETFKPELVLLDLVLPDIDGQDVATRLLEKDPRLKIAIVSGAKPEDPRFATLLSMGVFEIVRKPIRMEKLETLLKSLEAEERAYRRIR